AGSCTAGKKADMDMYARVLEQAAARGERVAPWVRFYIQCGSQDVKRYCEERGYLELFRKVGATFLEPSCGACINAGPGVSKTRDEVTISAINRNFPGRSGPGQLYLANPYTVAASAIAGYITEWQEGMALAGPPVVTERVSPKMSKATGTPSGRSRSLRSATWARTASRWVTPGRCAGKIAVAMRSRGSSGKRT